MCRCYPTHLPAQQPRAVRFLAYGTAPVLQTLHSDPNKLANLSCLLTRADSSCTTATRLPRLFPPQSLQTFHKEALTFFPPLQAFPTSCQPVVLGKNMRFPSQDLLIPIQNAKPPALLHCCLATWDGSATSNTQGFCNLSWFVGQDPSQQLSKPRS